MGEERLFMQTANQSETSVFSSSRFLRTRSQWELVAVVAVLAALSTRLLPLISCYALNVFFMDQWDFNQATLFQKHSLWEMFRWRCNHAVDTACTRILDRNPKGKPDFLKQTKQNLYAER
jgi:hypothetical protein